MRGCLLLLPTKRKSPVQVGHFKDLGEASSECAVQHSCGRGTVGIATFRRSSCKAQRDVLVPALQI